MPKSKLPPPGPSCYEARRTLWLNSADEPMSRPSLSSSSSCIKLEALLSQEGAVENEEIWESGLKGVWMGLVGGNQLRKRLPLKIVIKILQAGWQRDGTWPRGEAVLESDRDVTGFLTKELPMSLSPTFMEVELISTSTATGKYLGASENDGIGEG